MSNVRFQRAFGGNHASPVRPLFLRAWGTSRFPTPLDAHRAGADL